MRAAPGGCHRQTPFEETAHMYKLVSLAAAAALFVTALFGADVGGYWP
jgi:hypothetical protein